jgi:hypothetical protein
MSEMMGVEQTGASADLIASDMVESAYTQTKTTRAIESGSFITRTNIPSTSAM